MSYLVTDWTILELTGTRDIAVTRHANDTRSEHPSAGDSRRQARRFLAKIGTIRWHRAARPRQCVFEEHGRYQPTQATDASDLRVGGDGRVLVCVEGGGLVVLKRLSAALAECDRVYAVIRGSAAHVVLEEAPPREGTVAREPAVYVLPISARSRDGLLALAREYLESLSRGSLRVVSLGDVCYTACVRTAHLEHRFCVVGRTRAALLARLEALLRGESSLAAPTSTEELAAVRYARGEKVDFRALQRVRRAHVSLPSHAWQRAPKWSESAEVVRERRVVGAPPPRPERHRRVPLGG